MKKSTILIIVMAVLVVGLFVFIAFDGGNPDAMTACPDCEAITCSACEGEKTAMENCSSCEGEGTSPLYITCLVCGGESSETCKYCSGNGYVEKSFCATCEGAQEIAADTPYYRTWASLLAPVIAIALALITKEVYSSLVIGIIAGGLLAADFNIVKTVDLVI